MLSPYQNIDTPALLIDRDIMTANIRAMQKRCDEAKVSLRPHIKTHRMSEIALLQVEEGAAGIACAKTGEAEVMASRGLDRILIANEIIGETKLRRLARLARKMDISFGVDSLYGAREASRIFTEEGATANLLIEVDVGEVRSGIEAHKAFLGLLKEITTLPGLSFRGLFSHDGHSYKAASLPELSDIFMESQKETLSYAKLAGETGFPPEVVSIGSTPPFLYDFDILPGITEVRIGTYVFMDVIQGNILGSYERSAASILATVMSLPAPDRVVIDAGAKALTTQEGKGGLGRTRGLGLVKGSRRISVDKVYDEHGVFFSQDLAEEVSMGDKIEILPNHICPVVNLFDSAYLVSKGEVIKELSIDCRGKST